MKSHHKSFNVAYPQLSACSTATRIEHVSSWCLGAWGSLILDAYLLSNVSPCGAGVIPRRGVVTFDNVGPAEEATQPHFHIGIAIPGPPRVPVLDLPASHDHLQRASWRTGRMSEPYELTLKALQQFALDRRNPFERTDEEEK